MNIEHLFAITIVLLAVQAGFPRIGRTWGIIWGLYFSVVLTVLFA